MTLAFEFLTVLFEFDGQDLFGLLRLGKAFAQLLLGSLLHIHVVVILELPVVIIADAGILRRIVDMETFFRIPDEVDGESEDKSPQLTNNDHR